MLNMLPKDFAPLVAMMQEKQVWAYQEGITQETSSLKTSRRWGVQTGKCRVPKLAKNAPNPCKPVKDSVRLKHALLSRKGKGRCLDRNDLAGRAPMSGRASSNGRSGCAVSVPMKSP